MKTITKQQLLARLASLPDAARITFALEPEELHKAQAAAPDGVPLLQFGLPGDCAVGDDGIEFLLWAATERAQIGG